MPSRFYFYSWDSLSIRRFTLLDLRKIYTAGSTQDLRTLAEGINSSIDKDVFSLTIGDFWFLMYWHRLNSYKKHPWNIQFPCDEHCKEDEATKNDRALRLRNAYDEKAREEINKELLHGCVISNTNTDIKYLDIEEFEKCVNDATTPIEFYPMTVSELVEISEISHNMRERKSKDVTGQTWFNEYAALLSREYGKLLKHRIKWLETKSEDEDFNFDEFLEDFNSMFKASDHGVIEVVDVPCRRCGSTRQQTLSFDALDFFPDVQRAASLGS